MVIGRNEGARLGACLASVVRSTRRVVYVDSGSTDGSVALAQSMGVAALKLDAGTPYTAARARNEGFARIRELVPGLRYVQFVDGDCEMNAAWLESAVAFLETHSEVAAVCGRVRERDPERSIYNLLCDIEWDMPVGESKSCGGIAMLRAEALARAGGYRAGLIAGEEPELCVRLRAAGWQIWRLDGEMSLHDAAMTRFAQWWKRSMRTGYSYAQGVAMHGAPPERHRVRESRSAWFWGLGLPAAIVASTALVSPACALVSAAYPFQVVRLALRGTRSTRENWWRALYLVIGKFAEAAGQLRFVFLRCVGGESRLMEYK